MDDVKKSPLKNQGNVFLVVVDQTQEFLKAIDYASIFSGAKHRYIALLNVIEPVHVENWQGIEKKVKKDMRDQAERMVWDAAGRVYKNTATTPMVCIEEGRSIDVILKVIEENKNISALVLAAASSSSSPGPLVSYFSGKGLSRLSVPLMIVPDHLEPLEFAN